MVYRVVSTKLTEEEHTKLLDACNTEGCTPSSLIKDAIMKRLENEKKVVEKPEEKITEKPQEKKPRTLEEMLRLYKKTK